MVEPSTRLARALPAFALLAAGMLFGSQVLAWWGIERAARDANRGQADVLLEAIDLRIAQLDHAPRQEDLAGLLAEFSERGVRYLAVTHPESRTEAGEAALSDPQPPELFSERGDRVRVTRILPPAPGVAPPPPPPNERRPGRPTWSVEDGAPPSDAPPHPPAGGFGPLPHLIVEAEPRVGAALRADGVRALVAAGAAGVLFMAFAFALRRESQRREAMLLVALRDRRLTALGQMSAVLAHELRNPLASLKGHTQLLLELVRDDRSTPPTGTAAKVRLKAERIVGDAVKLEELTLSLLAFVRSGELHLEPVDFRGIVERAADEAGGATLQVPDAEVDGRADPARLQQALCNLIQNARQAAEHPPEVQLVVHRKEIEVRVMDRGPGVDLDHVDGLFEPFHTTRAQGTGLGLAITKSIVDAHHGSVHVQNRSDGGALFSLRVPRWGQE